MKQLGESFSMKDMKVVKNIFDISILPDKKENKLWLSHEHYIKKVLHIFQMENVKAVNTPHATHFKLSDKQSPPNEVEKTHMSRVPYASTVCSLMYTMVCTRPNITCGVGTINQFLSNPGESIGML